MIDEKRYLFRGFHKRNDGSETIMLDGEKIKGEWVCGSYGYDKQNFCIRDGYEYKAVLPETVGQWVTTDNNGKNVFEGDKIKSKYSDIVYIVVYDEHKGCWKITNNYGGMIVPSHWALEHLGAEVVGNKWEAQE